MQRCLDLRRKYIARSLQRPSDNPKNNVDRWRIYPPPPRPRWTYNEETGSWQDHKDDFPKMGVGEDFNMRDCAVPGRDVKVFRLDAGVYQVFADEKGFSLLPDDHA